MFQDFNSKACANGPSQAPPRVAAAEAAELVARYPNLSEIELARLINLYRGFSALDMALMISDEQAGPKLGRFIKDHRSTLRAPFRHYALLVLYAALGGGALIWAAAFAS